MAPLMNGSLTYDVVTQNLNHNTPHSPSSTEKAVQDLAAHLFSLLNKVLDWQKEDTIFLTDVLHFVVSLKL